MNIGAMIAMNTAQRAAVQIMQRNDKKRLDDSKSYLKQDPEITQKERENVVGK